MHAFPVHPASSDLKSLKHAVEVLNRDEVLGIFPQGRRLSKARDRPRGNVFRHGLYSA